MPKEGKEAVEEPAQPGEEKAQKKLPPQLNPLLARLARAAARENDKVPGQPFACLKSVLLCESDANRLPYHRTCTTPRLSAMHPLVNVIRVTQRFGCTAL